VSCEVCDALEHEPCELCGLIVHVGAWPWCPHQMVESKAHGFEPHFDIGLGRLVTGWGDVKQEMRRRKLDYRDRPSKGWLDERANRANEGARKRA